MQGERCYGRESIDCVLVGCLVDLARKLRFEALFVILTGSRVPDDKAHWARYGAPGCHDKVYYGKDGTNQSEKDGQQDAS